MKVNFDLSKIKAIIFDMDDLMINSHPVHMIIVEQVLNEYGVSIKDPKNPLRPEEESKFFGKKIIEAFEILRKKYGLEDKVTLEEMNEQFHKLLTVIFKEHVEPMPGLFKLMKLLKDRFRLVLASAATKEKIDLVLQKLHLEDGFEAIVSGEDEIKHGKPAPDIFLKAAEKLSVSPSECMVLEDAKNGVDAARAAGMRAVGVHNQFTFQRLKLRQDLSAADLQVESLYEVVQYLTL